MYVFFYNLIADRCWSRYFFHATAQRQSKEDFESGDEDEGPVAPEDDDESMLVTRSPSPVPAPKDIKTEEKVGTPPDSDTDNDSDGDDFKPEDDDDWFKVSDSTVDSSSFSFTQVCNALKSK
jgi:hypothetical protein